MRKKISIIGAGKVGGQAAMIAAYKQLGDIVIWNRTENTAKGMALDIMESSPVDNFDVNVIGTSYFQDTAKSDIIVITAGAQRQEGQSRDDLLFSNAEIVKSIVDNIAKYSKNAIYIVVTNPMDAMVWLTYRLSDLPRNKVIGMAGILDTARFRSFIAQELKVSVEDVSAMVLGGHGDFMLPLPAHSSVNGIPITKLLSESRISQIIDRTRKAGEEIIKLENSSAFFSPAYSLIAMIDSILKDKKRILPCAAYMQGEYGLRDIFMGVPVKLGAHGMEEILDVDLTYEEKVDFMRSAESIKSSVDKLKQKYNL